MKKCATIKVHIDQWDGIESSNIQITDGNLVVTKMGKGKIKKIKCALINGESFRN